MAKLNRWSASKLKCYQDCPFKFYCQYVEKIRIDDGNHKALTWGSCFHQCAEWFYNDFVFPSKEQLLSYYENNWIAEQYVKDWTRLKNENPNLQTWQFLGYDSREDEIQFFELGKRILSGFWDRHCAEVVHPFAIELKIEQELPTGDILLGYIDRVDSFGGMGYRIKDYKTGKWESTPEALKEDLQLGLYQWAFCKMYGIPHSSIEYCALYYVRSFNLVPVSFLSADIDRLLDKACAIITKVESDHFPKAPRQNWICKNCDFKNGNPCDEARM